MKEEDMKQVTGKMQETLETQGDVTQYWAEVSAKAGAQKAAYDDLAEQFHQKMAALAKATEPLRQWAATMQVKLQPAREAFQRFLEDQQAFRVNYGTVQKYLFEEGWYLGGDMAVPDCKALATMVEDSQHAEIEGAMCAWARTELDGIVARALRAFTHRAELIKDAGDAHRSGKYSLSIPVLFAQCDGIANEIIGGFLFRGDPPKALEKALNQFKDFPLSGLSDMLLEPLRSKSLFYTCSTRQRLKCGESPANRSEVLHGTQVDYASEANSLRVIVLLGYLVGVKSVLAAHSKEAHVIREMLGEAIDDVTAPPMEGNGEGFAGTGSLGE